MSQNQNFLKLLFAAQAGGANFTSDWFSLAKVDRAAIEISSAGTLVGTLTLEATNEEALGKGSKLPDSDYAFNGDDSKVWNLSDIGFPLVRIKWVYTSGAGSFRATMNEVADA